MRCILPFINHSLYSRCIPPVFPLRRDEESRVNTLKTFPTIDAIASDDKNFVNENKTSTIIATANFSRATRHKFLAVRYHNFAMLN